MFEKALPRSIDNTFTGHKSALWLFALILLIKITQSVSVLFAGASVISGADGIPLDTYTPPAAQTIVSVWAFLGFTRLLIYLLGVLVLVRYRSLVSFMFGLLLVQDAGRYLVLHFFPLVRVGSPVGPTVNAILTALTMVGLILSLVPKKSRSQSL
jgi:hypothetical protein